MVGTSQSSEIVGDGADVVDVSAFTSGNAPTKIVLVVFSKKVTVTDADQLLAWDDGIVSTGYITGHRCVDNVWLVVL